MFTWFTNAHPVCVKLFLTTKMRPLKSMTDFVMINLSFWTHFWAYGRLTRVHPAHGARVSRVFALFERTAPHPRRGSSVLCGGGVRAPRAAELEPQSPAGPEIRPGAHEAKPACVWRAGSVGSAAGALSDSVIFQSFDQCFWLRICTHMLHVKLCVVLKQYTSNKQLPVI